MLACRYKIQILELPLILTIYTGSFSYCYVENVRNVQFSTNFREGKFRKLCPLASHVYIYVDITFV